MEEKSSFPYLLLSLIFALGGVLLGLSSLPEAAFNLRISQFLQSVQTDPLLYFNIFISGFEFFIIFIAVPFFTNLYKKEHKTEAFFLLAAALTWPIVRLLKSAFALPCPQAPEIAQLYSFREVPNMLFLFPEREFCYPSGHAFDYTSFFGMIYFLRGKLWHNHITRTLLGAFSLALISLVGISRIFLGAHFLVDVLGGYLFGASWLFLLLFIYHQFFESYTYVPSDD